jgi:hypothetical protein
MMNSVRRFGDGSTKLLILVAALVMLSASLLVWGQDRDARPLEQAREFQALTGGLGFGPALELSRCSHSFDPRLSGRSPASAEPLVAGPLICPERAGSIFYYPRLQAHTR